MELIRTSYNGTISLCSNIISGIENANIKERCYDAYSNTYKLFSYVAKSLFSNSNCLLVKYFLNSKNTYCCQKLIYTTDSIIENSVNKIREIVNQYLTYITY